MNTLNGQLELVYGRHAVRAVILSRPKSIKRILIANGNRPGERLTSVTNEYLELTQEVPVKPKILPWTPFLNETGLTKNDGHQGICLLTKPRKVFGDQDVASLETAKLVVALDQLSNPRNLGSIIRSAAFFGIDALISMKYRAAELTPEVAKIAAGGAEFVKFYRVTNLARSLETLKKVGFWIYGLEERGSSEISQTKFDGKTALVIGAEGQGLRKKTVSTCDALVRIPGTRVGVESLNAGIAASIAIADVSRREFFQGSRE